LYKQKRTQQMYISLFMYLLHYYYYYFYHYEILL